MDPTTIRKIGQTELQVPCLGMGTAPIGDALVKIPQQQSTDTLATAWDAGIRFFDTAPWYGTGRAEHRLGHFISAQQRDEFVLTTKVGRVLERPGDITASLIEQERWRGGLPFQVRFDYTGGGVLRSYEDSLQRLGVNRIDALLIHDLDLYHHGDQHGVDQRFADLEESGFEALTELKVSGQIKAIGAGINHLGMIPQFLRRFGSAMDFFLVAMPYTLLDQDALAEEFPMIQQHGASVVIGAVFASGILATGVTELAQYAYAPAEADVIERTARLQEICARHAVPLGAAALQFPLAHPAVSAVIPGADHPSLIALNQQWIRHAIPSALWQELKDQQLIHPAAPTP